MVIGKRLYLKCKMPDPEIMEQFKAIHASCAVDVRYAPSHQTGQQTEGADNGGSGLHHQRTRRR